MPNRSGSTPAVVNATKRASGCSPRSRASSPDVTSSADAPSLVCDELPAVTLPADVERRSELGQRFD